MWMAMAWTEEARQYLVDLCNTIQSMWSHLAKVCFTCFRDASDRKPSRWSEPVGARQSRHDTTTAKRPLWENELNKEFSWAYHFSTWLVSMQKKERHQRKTQLHMQNMDGHMQNWNKTKKNKKARLDPWSDALNCVFMNPKWPSLHLHLFQAYASKMHIRLSDALLKGSISGITIDKVLHLKGNICTDCTEWFITCVTGKAGFAKTSRQRNSFGRVSFQSKRSYLFHVSVVHGVVRHFVRLQLDNLLELIAVAFPLAHYDHFVKQEYVPGETRAHVMHALSKCRTTSFLNPRLRILTDPVLFGWRWSTPWAPRQSSASHTPPVWPAA